jgi:hypothetical protein
MPDYQQGKIYCIRSHQTDDIYIGSTTKKYLSQRLTHHKTQYRIYLKEGGRYISSFKILEHDNSYIELIENYPCNSKAELNREEGKYQREMDCINKNIAGRTKKEWREDNKQELKEKAKQKITCECGGKYSYDNKSQHFKTKKHKKHIDETKQDDISS